MKTITFSRSAGQTFGIVEYAFNIYPYTYTASQLADLDSVDTTVNVPSLKNIHPAITNFDWATAKRNVTYVGMDGVTIIGQGSCGASGDNLTWILYSDGELILSGSGAMKDYSLIRPAPWQAYSAGTPVTKVTLPDGIASIGTYAFTGCSSLTAVNLPETVTAIGTEAFSDAGLTGIRIPAAVTAIGDRAFSLCADLAAVTFGHTGTDTLSLGGYAFNECRALEEIILPEGLVSIGTNSFYNCVKLKKVTLPGSLTTIGDFAFYGTALTAAALPAKVSSMGQGVFASCIALKTVTAAEGLSDLGSYTFNGCTELTSVTLPKSLTVLDGGVFYGCNKLASVALPSGLTQIGDSAFRNCTALTALRLPAGLTGIGEYAFDGCTNLALLHAGAITAPVLGPNVFSGVAAVGSLYIPMGASGYTAANGWPWLATALANVGGTVTLSDGTTPVSGAAVTVAGQSTTTDADGKFFLPSALAAGDYTLYAASGTARGILPLTITDTNREELAVCLYEALTLTGVKEKVVLVDYAAVSTAPYTLAGPSVMTVTKTSGDDAITWNNETGCLDIAAGLEIGSYPVVLTASCTGFADVTLTFTLKVVKTLPATADTSSAGLWLAGLFAAGLCLAALLVCRRKRAAGR